MKHYVNNERFYELLVKAQEYTLETLPSDLRNELGNILFLICTNLASRSNFGGYSFRDEMIQDAALACYKALYYFDPTKSRNPFAYFTKIAWHSFTNRIMLEKKQSYIKQKSLQRFLEAAEAEGMEISGDIIQSIIDDFENKLENKNEKKKSRS